MLSNWVEPMPPTATAKVLLALKSPPPVNPAPAVIVRVEGTPVTFKTAFT